MSETGGDPGASAPGATRPPGATAPGSPVPRDRRLRQVAIGVVLGVLAGFAAWYFLVREPDPRNDLERFRGDWQISVGGRGTPNVVHVEGDTWRYQAGATEGKTYRVTLKENADPKEIDLELLGAPKLVGPTVKMHGVYQFDGRGSVQMRLNPGTLPRPKSLDDAESTLWVLTRVKLEPAPEPGSK